MTEAIIAEGLVKTYGSVRAVDGLDLSVREGSVLGMLGPNGAGKTTTVRMLTTLLRPDSGKITVAGVDVVKNPQQVRGKIGLSGQYAAVDEYLTGFENLDMFGRLYHLGAPAARARARELLERFDLSDAADRPAKTYSGGMRRRLDLAGALVARPPVVFLDEPTTGLDPRSRIGMWGVIGDLVKDGTTVLLTTQYLEEADRLADSIMVIDHGKVIATGTAESLKGELGGERVQIEVSDLPELEQATEILRKIGSGDVEIDSDAHTVSVPVTRGTSALVEAVRQLDAIGVAPRDIGIHRPSLDDVFLKLTGRTTAAEEGESA